METGLKWNSAVRKLTGKLCLNDCFVSMELNKNPYTLAEQSCRPNTPLQDILKFLVPELATPIELLWPGRNEATGFY